MWGEICVDAVFDMLVSFKAVVVGRRGFDSGFEFILVFYGSRLVGRYKVRKLFIGFKFDFGFSNFI